VLRRRRRGVPMSSTASAFAGSIPAFYDEFLVPLIFHPYAEDMTRRVVAAGPRTVLEIAAGTGAVTRALAAALPAGVRQIATDISQPMLDRAMAHGVSRASVEWRQADALALPFAEATADVVVCQFGVMFYPDRVRGYREALRVLRSGGVFLFNVWDSLEANPFTLEAAQAIARMFPADPPRFMERTPHGYHDEARIRADLEEAGFTAILIETVPALSHADGAETVARAFCYGTPLRGEIETRDAAALDRSVETVAAAIAAKFGRGPVSAPISAKVVTARA